MEGNSLIYRELKNEAHVLMDLYSPIDVFYIRDFVFTIVGQTSSSYHKKQFIVSTDLSSITAGKLNVL